MPRRDSSSDSDRGSYRRRRDRKRNSSSPDSRGNSESSNDRIKRKTYRSRSRSGSRTRSSRRRSRSRSLSPRRSPRRYSHRSRSTSRSRTSGRRSRSGSRRRRSRSRSGSRKPSHRHSKSNSPKPKTTKIKEEKEGTGADYLKQKVQQAIKAAATASAELREKGFLGESNTSTTISDQLKRAQAIDDINAQSFVQQEFISSRNLNKTVTPKTEDNFDKDGHMSAIFGLAAPKLGLNTNPADASIKKLESWKENPEMLVHESLFVDQSGKQERWLKKLFVMRKKKINITEDM